MTGVGGSPGPGPGRFKAAAILVGIFLALVVLGAAFLFGFKRQIAARFLRSGALEALGDTDLSEADRERVMASLERVLDLYEEGELDEEKQKKLLDAFNESPVSKWFLIARVKSSYLDPAALSGEEKEKARADLDRLLRGMAEGKISSEELMTAAAGLPRREDLGGMLDFERRPGDEELRGFAAGVAALVESKAIPAGDFELDVAAEAERIVDRALGEAPAKAVDGERER